MNPLILALIGIGVTYFLSQKNKDSYVKPTDPNFIGPPEAGSLTLKMPLQTRYDSFIKEICAEHDMTYYFDVIKAIIQVESNYQKLVIGRNTEKGLMQLKPVVFQDVNTMYGKSYKYSEGFKVPVNLNVGILFFKLQLKRMNNKVDDALRAYNQGERGAKLGRGYSYLEKIRRYLNV